MLPPAVAQNLLPQAPAPSVAPQPSFTLQERWDHYLTRTYSWQRMSLLALDVGTDMTISKPRRGRTADVYADRYAGAFLRRATRTTVEFGAGAMLHEDIRRRESGRQGFGPRLKYALAHTWTAYQPDGSSRFAYSRLVGALGGIAVYETWRQHPITTGRMTHQLSWALASNLQDALLAEFGPDMKRLGLRMKKRFMRSSDKP